MRDDIVQLLHKESSLLNKKLGLIHTLLLRESEKIFFIRSGDHDRTAKIIEQCTEITDEIDSLDFHLSANEQKLSGKLGVSRHKMAGHLATIKQAPTEDVLQLRKRVHAALKELLAKNEESTALLMQASDGLKKDIAEINDIIRLRKNQPGD